jgi:uncharacterized protein
VKVSAGIFVLLVCAALFVGARAGAADFKPASQVVDHAQILPPQTLAQLNKLAQESERVTGRQLVIGVVKSYEGRAPANYAQWIYQNWGVGEKGKPGALLLVSLKEQSAQIMAGPGLESLLPVNIQQAIAGQVVVPQLKSGRPEMGIVSGATAMIMALQGSYQQAATQVAAAQPAYTPAAAPGGHTSGSWSPTTLLVIFVLARLLGFGRRRGGLSYMRGGIFGRGPFGGARRRW